MFFFLVVVCVVIGVYYLGRWIGYMEIRVKEMEEWDKL